MDECRTWREYARFIPDQQVILTTADTITNNAEMYADPYDIINKDLIEFAKIMKSKRTRAHENVIRRAWELRKNRNWFFNPVLMRRKIRYRIGVILSETPSAIN